MGAGIRVIADGAWGFAATEDLTQEGVERCAAEAVAIAKASARVKERPLQLVAEKPAKAEWSSPCEIDPFTTSVDDNLQLLMSIDAALRGVQGVTLAETSLNFRRYEQWFYNTEGSDIHQTAITDRGGLCRPCVCRHRDPEALVSELVWRAVAEQRLRAGRRIAAAGERAAHGARSAWRCIRPPQCPQGRLTLVLDSSQLGLQIHESMGHPIELDRVLGMEANFAGTSFLTLDKLRNLRYGSELVNVVADAHRGARPGAGNVRLRR